TAAGTKSRRRRTARVDAECGIAWRSSLLRAAAIQPPRHAFVTAALAGAAPACAPTCGARPIPLYHIHGTECFLLGTRTVGVCLWLADVATGVSVHRAGRGAPRRRSSRPVRLFLRPPRNTRAAGPGAWSRPGWNLSRHCLPGARSRTREDHRL